MVATQSLTPHPGQYFYFDSRSDYPARFGANCEIRATDHRQIWIGANGSGLLRETMGRAEYASAPARAACRGIPRGDRLGASGNTWFAPRCLTLGPTSDWRSLSTDPHVLLRQMRRIDGGPPTPAEDFVHVGDFLRETDAPPAIRAAIYKAAALISGTKLLGRVRDHDGRRGLGVAYTSHGSTSELIFDPRTGELLGEQGTGPAGPYWVVYLRERIVNRLPGRAPIPLKPACIATAGHVTQTRSGAVVTGTGNPGVFPITPRAGARPLTGAPER